MDIDAVLAFVLILLLGRAGHPAADGRPQPSNVGYVVDDDGVVRISVTDDRAK